MQIDRRLQLSKHLCRLTVDFKSAITCELSDELLMKIDSRLQLRDHLQLSQEVCPRAVGTACIPPTSLLEI